MTDNHYEGFDLLRKRAESAAAFLDATTRRARGQKISLQEIAQRCEDMAASLRETVAEAEEKFFKM